MIKSWSYSSLLLFEKCPYAAKLKHVDKIPEPQNKYSSRGTDIHAAAEAFVKSETPALDEALTPFKAEFGAVRELYSSGKVLVEEEWAHDSEWNMSNWRDKDTWCRLKLDFFIKMDNITGLVVDLKSGKKYGNEIKHAEQGQLYAGIAFLRNPELQRIITEFWYVDQDDLTQVVYTPQQAGKFLAGFDRRARRMTSIKEFKPNPSIFTCKWCPYRPEAAGGGGQCKFGVNTLVKRK